MSHRFLGFLLAFTLLSGAVQAEKKPDLEALDRLLAEAQKDLATPGLAAALVIGDEIVFAKGYGTADRARNRPMTADVPVEIGSVTKLLTALALNEARVDLQAPVSKWLPELKEVTVHQLLTHTSGLLDREAEYGPVDATPAVLLKELKELCRFPVGARFSYSNPGYALAGLVLERATGESYSAAMNRWLFDPVGLDKRDRFTPPEGAAIGYTYDEKDVESPAPPPIDGRFTPAGYAWLNMKELAKVGAALFKKGRLREETVRNVTTPWAKVEGLPGSPDYGYGLYIREQSGTKMVYHDGSMTGFTTLLRIVPERKMAIALVFNRNGPTLPLDRKLRTWMLGEAARPPAALPPLGAEEAAALVGKYEHRFPLEIIKTDKGAALRFGPRELPIGRLGEGRYAVELLPGEDVAPIVPWKGKDGRVEGIQFLVWAFPRISG